MTTEPKASLGGDEPKANAPVAWRYRRKGHQERCWTICEHEPHIRDTHEVQPLYAAPVLPVEVREKVKGLIALADVEVTYDSVGRQYTHIRNAKEIAKTILSTITGDA